MSTNANTETSDTPERGAIALTAGRLTTLRDYNSDGKDIAIENFDLIAKVIWLINIYPGWDEDGTFTFPDGETWANIKEQNDG